MRPDWRGATVASDGTHHEVDGVPLYEARFQEVLKFHAPGLAPARDTSGMYHIDTSGNAAYRHRYRRTFGFYEGLAAVDTSDTWTHVSPAGEPAYAARWAWCGNFQEGRCPVRDRDGGYLHIGRDGTPITPQRWRYAGDFRDGVAVVQAETGRSTHVDTSGWFTHGKWFLDLDVFHKGFARARDEAGWTHVDARGEPIYARRFAMVEPFYNGQARVERFDGGLEVIGEDGRTRQVLRAHLAPAAPEDPGETAASAGPSPGPYPAPRAGWTERARPEAGVEADFDAVASDLVSWRTDTIHAAVTSGLLDRLPLGSVHAEPEAVRRLLGALGELGLVRRDAGTWVLTARGRLLADVHPRSLGASARYWATEGRAAWDRLPAALRDPAFTPPDPFVAQASSPERVRAYHRAMAPYAARDYRDLPSAVAPCDTLLDAGGGLGVAARILLDAGIAARAVVLDRPEVVAPYASDVDVLLSSPSPERPTEPPDARIGPTASGVREDLRFLAFDLFEPWPVRGDAVLLARVLHDWDDARARTILARARDALTPGGKLYVVELLREEDSFHGAILDLHMLLATGGRERTRAEFDGLLDAAGLRLTDVRPLPGVSSVLVAEPA